MIENEIFKIVYEKISKTNSGNDCYMLYILTSLLLSIINEPFKYYVIKQRMCQNVYNLFFFKSTYVRKPHLFLKYEFFKKAFQM